MILHATTQDRAGRDRNHTHNHTHMRVMCDRETLHVLVFLITPSGSSPAVILYKFLGSEGAIDIFLEAEEAAGDESEIEVDDVVEEEEEEEEESVPVGKPKRKEISAVDLQVKVVISHYHAVAE